MRLSRSFSAAGQTLLFVAGASLLSGGAVLAQGGGASPETGYQVGESKQANPATTGAIPQNPTLRLARFDYVSGKVTWRPNDSAKWAKATTNLPLRQGAQIWCTDGGRAEIRFEDGSLLRLGNDAVVTLQTFYRDAKGQFTEIKMVSGIATLHLKQERSVYQVDAPFVNVESSGPSRIRVGVGNTVEVGVNWGQAMVEGEKGKITLESGDFLAMHNADSPYERRNLPHPDSWERWNDERDYLLAKDDYPAHSGPRTVYLPATSWWLSLNFPIGRSYHSHWDGDRGARRHR